MKAERLFRAIGLVDEGLIEAAAETPAKKRPVWRRYAAAAACLMVLCGAGAAYLITGGFRGYGASAGGSGINNAGSAADAVAFMSYAGPVLPLTTADENPGRDGGTPHGLEFYPQDRPGGVRFSVGRGDNGRLYPRQSNRYGCDADPAVSHCGRDQGSAFHRSQRDGERRESGEGVGHRRLCGWLWRRRRR